MAWLWVLFGVCVVWLNLWGTFEASDWETTCGCDYWDHCLETTSIFAVNYCLFNPYLEQLVICDCSKCSMNKRTQCRIYWVETMILFKCFFFFYRHSKLYYWHTQQWVLCRFLWVLLTTGFMLYCEQYCEVKEHCSCSKMHNKTNCLIYAWLCTCYSTVWTSVEISCSLSIQHSQDPLPFTAPVFLDTVTFHLQA